MVEPGASDSRAQPWTMEVYTCRPCDAVQAGPADRCVKCGGTDLVASQISGLGSLVTWTVVRRPADSFADAGPLTIGLVDLDGGPRVTARIEAPGNEPALGARMRMIGVQAGTPVCTPVYTPVCEMG